MPFRVNDIWKAIMRGSLIVAPFVSLPGTALAQAQPSGPNNPPKDAEVLYAKAMEHLKNDQPRSAIRLLEASLDMDPAADTRVNLAVAYQAVGKLGRAYRHFRIAEREDLRTGQTDRAAFSRQSAEELMPSLGTMYVRIDPRYLGVKNLVVTLDEDNITQDALLGASIPVEKGEHQLVVKGDSIEPQRYRVRIPISPPQPVEVYVSPFMGATTDKSLVHVAPVPVAYAVVAGIFLVGGAVLSALTVARPGDEGLTWESHWPLALGFSLTGAGLFGAARTYTDVRTHAFTSSPSSVSKSPMTLAPLLGQNYAGLAIFGGF